MVYVRTSDPTAVLEQAAADFVVLGPRLFSVAYRIVGSAAEAKHIVQEVWLRWQVTNRAVVEAVRSVLAAGRLADPVEPVHLDTPILRIHPDVARILVAPG